MAGSEKASSSQLRRQLVALGLFPLSELIAWSSIFPYIHAMVTSLGRESDPEGRNTAFYASLLVSVFTFGEFLMAPQWAKISDRLGRKPTLLLGSLGAMFSAVAFGFTSSLPMAIVARSLGGMLNPNVGVIDTYIGELVSKEQQARGFSAIAFARGLGAISGPVVGGYLAEPSSKLPSIFPVQSVWGRFPYLLPNLVVVVCLATSCTLGFLFLREVHPHLRDKADIRLRIWAALRGCVGRARRDKQGDYTLLSSRNHVDVEDDWIPPESSVKVPKIDRRKAFTKQVLLQILSSTVLGFIQIANLALVPIFLGTEQPAENKATQQTLGGGFGLDTENTSHILLTQALVSILAQVFVVPKVVVRVGTLRSYRMGLVLWTANYIVAPLSILLPRTWSILAFTLSLWVHSLCSGIVSTNTSIMITNTVPAPIYLATVNGAATSSSCLARTAGPIVVGALFRVGLDAGNVGISFWALAGATTTSFLLSWTLKEHRPVEESTVQEMMPEQPAAPL